MTRRSVRGEAGQATVELALLLPLIVGIAFLLAQVATVIEARVVAIHTAREVARALVVDPSVDPQAIAEQSTSLDPTRLSTSVSGGAEPGQLVTVVVRYRVQIVIPLLGVVAEPLVEGDATMAVESS